jgi:hypothetical protein
MSDDAQQLVYAGRTDQPTSPRVLVQYTMFEADLEAIDHYAWGAVQPNGVIDDTDIYEREVIGFAEFPPNTNVNRFTDAEEFAAYVEDKAVYVHWKPAADAIDVTGAPFDTSARGAPRDGGASR